MRAFEKKRKAADGAFCAAIQLESLNLLRDRERTAAGPTGAASRQRAMVPGACAAVRDID